MPSAYPVSIHNNTNGAIVVRYLNEDRSGTNEIQIGPRLSKRVQGFNGMNLFASNSFDPNEAYAQVKVDNYADDVYFSENGGGLGKGSPAAPPEKSTQTKTTRQSQRQPKSNTQRSNNSSIPGDSADNHGTSLRAAHKGGLLVKEDDGGEGEDVGLDSGDDMIEIPGLGYVKRSSVPPHLLQQYEAQAQAHVVEVEQHQYPQYTQYVNVDDLPPLEIPTKEKEKEKRTLSIPIFNRPLTYPETLLAKLLHRLRLPEKWARPLFIVILIALAVVAVQFYRRRSALRSGRRRKNKIK